MIRLCENEKVRVYEGQGEDVAKLLAQAAVLIKEDPNHGIVRVFTEPQVDPDTGRFIYVVTAYVHA